MGQIIEKSKKWQITQKSLHRYYLFLSVQSFSESKKFSLLFCLPFVTYLKAQNEKKVHEKTRKNVIH
jgi:hypothetical protein